MKRSDTHRNCSDGRIYGGAFADLNLVDGLLKDGTSSIGTRDDIHFDNCLGKLSPGVRSLYRDAVLFAGVEFAHRFNNAGFRIDLELLYTIVRYVVNTVGYFSVFTLVVIRGFHLLQ